MTVISVSNFKLQCGYHMIIMQLCLKSGTETIYLAFFAKPAFWVLDIISADRHHSGMTTNMVTG